MPLPLSSVRVNHKLVEEVSLRRAHAHGTDLRISHMLVATTCDAVSISGANADCKDDKIVEGAAADSGRQSRKQEAQR
jgi:hypothetical protein